jgi:thiol:disulfide interchange protein DsbA
MRLIRQLLTVFGFALIAVSAHAANGTPEVGKEYRVLDRPQPTESGKKIEVIEFFGYFCPHCRAFDPSLTEWVKKQGNNINFKRVHVNFHNLATQQKLYYTLEAMGKIEELHTKVFDAYHVERNRLTTDTEVMAFAAKQGLDVKKFSDVYNSFSIQSKLSRSAQMQEAYRVDGVPNVAIDGRFMTSPSDVGNAQAARTSEQVQFFETLKVMDWLVAKAQKEKAK